jgi:hypothetical protein
MAIQVKKGNQLTAPPAGAALKYLVTDTNTGRYYTTNVGGGDGGGSSAEPYQVSGDFEIAVTQHQVLEYICFIGLPGQTKIYIESEVNAEDIKTLNIADAQPVVLMVYMDVDKIIYVRGVPEGTFIKTKFS